MLRPGELVEVTHPADLSVEPGALALVVNGQRTFPELAGQLRRCLEDYDDVTMGDFVCLFWVRSDPRWKGQQDGFYVAARFAPHALGAEEATPSATERDRRVSDVAPRGDCDDEPQAA